MKRKDRGADQLRPIRIETDYLKDVPGSVLIEHGHTRVLCSATLENRVPFFLRDTGKGWIKAEYGMLPASVGSPRLNRERQRSHGRHIEIQRFIGRSLRCVFDLGAVDGHTIHIDADVLQADGGTRCAAVNGGFIALSHALRHLVFENRIKDLPAIMPVAAVSVGILEGEVLVDLDHREDAAVEADINLVVSDDDEIVQLGVFAEENRIPRKLFNQALDAGMAAGRQILDLLKAFV